MTFYNTYACHNTIIMLDGQYNLGGRGGLGVKAKIAERRQGDDQGSPLRQWKKVTPPLTTTLPGQLQIDFLICVCVCVCVCICVHNHWAPGRVAFRLKAAPVKKVRILYPLIQTSSASVRLHESNYQHALLHWEVCAIPLCLCVLFGVYCLVYTGSAGGYSRCCLEAEEWPVCQV